MELRVLSRRISRPTLALLLTGAAGLFGNAAVAQQAQAPNTIEARVQACAACHGKMGQGADNDYFPRLAGKPAGYLYNQLRNFREGRRRYPPMNYLVTYLSDDYLHEIAAYFSAQRPPYPAPDKSLLPQATLDRGRDIVMHGDPANGVPACMACHGAALTGRQPGIPGLVGLHADYISAQLGAWRTGSRHAIEPDCMHHVATHLNDSDISAVAAWLAMQPAPKDPTPAAASASKLPLQCGSEPQ